MRVPERKAPWSWASAKEQILHLGRPCGGDALVCQHSLRLGAGRDGSAAAAEVLMLALVPCSRWNLVSRLVAGRCCIAWRGLLLQVSTLQQSLVEHFARELVCKTTLIELLEEMKTGDDS
jgi:hypothetical protein